MPNEEENRVKPTSGFGNTQCYALINYTKESWSQRTLNNILVMTKPWILLAKSQRVITQENYKKKQKECVCRRGRERSAVEGRESEREKERVKHVVAC